MAFTFVVRPYRLLLHPCTNKYIHTPESILVYSYTRIPPAYSRTVPTSTRSALRPCVTVGCLRQHAPTSLPYVQLWAVTFQISLRQPSLLPASSYVGQLHPALTHSIMLGHGFPSFSLSGTPSSSQIY